MRGYFLSLVLLVFLLFLPLASAVDQVVINSKDWRDVYTGVVYAKLSGLDVHYVAEETQGLQLIKEVLNPAATEILLIESEKPFVISYQPQLEKAGFTVEKFISLDAQKTNLEFAKRIIAEKGITDFIVVDGGWGYDALSVASYALLTRSFVLFASAENADSLFSFLSASAENIILYGHLDRVVKEELGILNPQIINKGDRYEDNIEIVKNFLDKKPTKQVLLADGEVLELGFFNNEFPVLFVGTSNVPRPVTDFIKDTDIRTGIVIGYNLFANAKKIRDDTGIKILLKYGQGRNSQLYALDVFPLPRYDPKIDIEAAFYNTLSRQLEVVYKNAGGVYTYAQGLSHQIKADGIGIANVGDEQAFFLNEGDVLTKVYRLDLGSYLENDLTMDSKIIFGESADSLTKLLVKTLTVDVVAVDDSSKISLQSVVYNKGTNRFELVVKNEGGKDVYADAEIVDLIIASEKVTLGAELQKIKPGQKNLFKIKAVLEDVDIEDNPAVTARIRYGEREGILLKSITQEFDFAFKKFNYKLLVLVVIILIIIKLMLSIRKKRQK